MWKSEFVGALYGLHLPLLQEVRAAIRLLKVLLLVVLTVGKRGQGLVGLAVLLVAKCVSASKAHQTVEQLRAQADCTIVSLMPDRVPSFKPFSRTVSSRRKEALMRRLNEPQATGTAKEAPLQPEEAGARIAGILQTFEVIPSKTEQHLFRYASLYFLGLLCLLTVLDIAGGLLLGWSRNYPPYVSMAQRTIGYQLLAAVGISLVCKFWN